MCLFPGGRCECRAARAGRPFKRRARCGCAAVGRGRATPGTDTPRPQEAEWGRWAKFPGPPGGRLVLPRGRSDVESAVRRQQPVTPERQPGHRRGRLAEQRLRGSFRPGIPFRHARVASRCRAWLRVRRIETGPRNPGVTCSRAHYRGAGRDEKRQPGLTGRGSISRRCRPGRLDGPRQPSDEDRAATRSTVHPGWAALLLGRIHLAPSQTWHAACVRRGLFKGHALGASRSYLNPHHAGGMT